ncbi:MAG TPA: hypothetical protein VGC65_04250 [Bacteroidia bacterium]|jgi:hypothetical protein
MKKEEYKVDSVPLSISYKGKIYNGEAIPLSGSCHDNVCDELNVTLNGEHLGTIHLTPAGWTMDKAADQDFVNAIGESILMWYK